MMPYTSQADKGIDLSIIIVNYNTSRLLKQCLQSIYDTTTEDWGFEIFLVDNASSDDSVEMVRSHFPQVKLLINPAPLGFTRAVNRPLSVGMGRYFLLIHPDVKLLPGAMQEMLSFLATRSQVGVVGANLMYPDNGGYNLCAIKRISVRQELVEFTWAAFHSVIQIWPWLRKSFDKEQAAYYWDHQATVESELIWNACMMFKREVLEAIGNFCEDFYVWFADTDWCYKVKNAGWQMYYLLNAKVVHYEQQSGNFLDSQLVRYKVRPALVNRSLNKDRYTLLKRHYSPFRVWLRKVIDIAFAWITFLKLAQLRVFAPARHRSTLDLTR
jgi:GT2 family glycosyltransferase